MTNKYKEITIIIIGTFFIYGCAKPEPVFSETPKYPITYDSFPQGGSVICNGTNYGYTPVTLQYTLTEENQKYGAINTSKCKVIWSTGVSADYSSTWNLVEFPNGVKQTLQRPNVAGFEIDSNFALKVQQMKNQQMNAIINQSNNQMNDSINQQNDEERNRQLQNMNNYMRYGY